jgi:hypothetical protein
MVSRVVVLIFACTIAACQVPNVQPTLTAAAATRIADSKAHSFRPDIDYQHGPAQYQAADDSWWIGYSQRGTKLIDFNVRVEAKTREASIVLR